MEYIKLLSWFRGAKSILEIGSRFGYPLVDFAHCMDGKGLVVSVDLPDSEGWNPPLNTQEHLEKNIQSLKDEGYNTHLFLGDSHSPEIISRVINLSPFDVVFIDGDHSYRGAKTDWEYYGPLGKRVIFHDIRKPEPPENEEVQVWKLWKEIKRDHEVEEYISPGSKMGIGLVNP